ncbi:hypothetical protein [Paenibacillus sp. GM1FR]|uniref:hypothetical protein n=1 Tax=Paenibacillus sp. GM1FR TaxID=2059267 RepID=UPI000C2727D1|nr:hypothetical protein [Paenibacillus sp. GM1FR]
MSFIPKSNSEPQVKPNPVFGWLVRSNLIEAEESEAAASLRRTMFVVLYAWEPSCTAARQRIAACDQPDNRSGDMA